VGGRPQSGLPAETSGFQGRLAMSILDMALVAGVVLLIVLIVARKKR
jgi:hypothetical protein